MKPPGRTRWRRAVLVACALAGAGVLGFFLYVRGSPVGPALPGAGIDAAIQTMAAGPPEIDGQPALQAIGTVAASLVTEEGTRPGPFHLQFLERLDRVEKLRHLAHGPFTGIVRMYCDIWIHSITTYGRRETTYGPGGVEVRPSLKLPVLIFLLDRLGRGKTALEEYLGAPFEAVRGMEVHGLPGRARVWRRILAMCERHPPLAGFVVAQLDLYDPSWTDGAELAFWDAVGRSPRRAVLSALAGAAAPAAPGGARPAAMPVPAARTARSRAFLSLIASER